MSGLYLHIPFCKKACVYCDFHFSTNHTRKSEMIESIICEIHLRADFLPEKKLDSIYFGGGTPSLLNADEINALLDAVETCFQVSPKAEISLEANPDDLDIAYLKELAKTSINRLSVGIQSFREEDLKMMNRSHNAEQALSCIKNAQDYGIENISLDLIYGIPGMENEEWVNQIETAVSLNVPHISSYALTVEPKTVLAHKVKTGEIIETQDETIAQQFELLGQNLSDAGFEHYEVSNFAKPGHRAVHNSSYWQGKPYLGVGPSAHSFKDHIRQWNVSNNPVYIKNLQKGELASETEYLSDKDSFNEAVMIALRTKEGVDMDRFEEKFGADFFAFLKQESQPYVEAGKLILDNGFLRIPQNWRFHSDGI